MSFAGVEELNRDPRKGMVGIDFITAARANGERVCWGG